MKQLFFLPIGILILVSFIGFSLAIGGVTNVNFGASPVHLTLNTTAEKEAVFDGVNDYIRTENLSSQLATNDSTVSAWIYIKEYNSSSFVWQYSSSNRWLKIDNLGRVNFFFLNATAFCISEPLSKNRWYNLVGLRNNTNLDLYIDGVLEQSSNISISGGNIPVAAYFTMGASYNYPTPLEYFNGSIDEVMIWNRTLSASEVANLYLLNRSEYNYSRESLIDYYSFDNGYNNFVDSVSGINGTDYNGVYTLNSNNNGNVPYDSLSDYFSFDRDNGTAFNLVNKGVNGIYQGNAIISPGLYSNSLKLDGVNSYLSLPSNNLTFLKGKTNSYSFWINTNNYSKIGGNSYSSAYSGADANVNGSVNINVWQTGVQITVGNSNNYSIYFFNQSLPILTWHYIVAEINFDSSNMTVYANGQSLGTQSFTSFVPTNPRPKIGSNQWSGNVVDYSNCSIDEVMIFGTALNSSQILDIYNNQSNRFVPVEVKNVSSILINSSQNYCNFTFGNYSRGFNSNLSLRVGEWDVLKGYNESDNGLVGYWHMDDLNVDSLSLNGENQFINGSPLSGLSYNQSRTYSLWIKNNINHIGAPHYQKGIFLANSGGCGAGRINLNPDGRISFDLGNNSICESVYSTSKIGNNSGWSNIVFTYDGSKSYSYINGVLENSANITLTPLLFPSQWIIGTYGGGTNYNGSIDDLMVFNRTLSQAEITNIYNLNRRSYNGSTSSLLNYWAFNDSNNILKDYVSSNDGNGSYSINGNTSAVSSLNENVGTVHGNPTNPSGQFGNAMNFDGVDDYLDVGNISDGFKSDNITIAFWAKPNQVFVGVTPIFTLCNDSASSCSSNYYAGFSLQNALAFSYKNSTVQIFKTTDNNVYVPLQWSHFLYVRSINGNNVTINFYVNGSLVGSLFDTNGFTSDYGTKAIIGAFLYANNSNSIYFNGSIDDIIVYNRTLSSSEIKSLYEVGRANYTYTNWQEASSNLSVNAPTTKLVALSENTTRIIPEWKFEASTNNFYSPYISGPFDARVMDTVKPLVQFESPTPEEGNGVTGSFIVNVSFTEKNLHHIVYSWNNTNTTYYYNNNLIRSLGNGNYLFTKTEIAPDLSSIYNLSVYVYDSDDNFNSTGVRRVSGNSAPTFNSFSYTPTSKFDLDPNENISFSANISDSENNLDSVYIYYKKDNGNWSNGTSLSALDGFYNYTFNFSEEGTYYINMTANDSFGFLSFRNVSLSIFWDCDWNSTSTLDAVAGYDENKFIGDISIENLGDAEYSNNNCSLSFRVSYDTTEGTIIYDGESVKGLSIESNPVRAGENVNVTINATFGTAVEQRDIKITLNEYRDRSDTSSRNTSVILVTNKEGPYLYQQITSYPVSVYLTPQNISIYAYLRNLMGSVIENNTNTAFNVSFNWELPSGVTNISGNLTNFYENISDLDKRNQNMLLGFEDLASITSGLKNFSISSSGVDFNGSSIKDAFNQTVLTSSVEISFLCYSVADGVYVADCGSQDGDYVAPANNNGGSGSGGGGGGASSQNKYEKSEANFELIIGKQQQFILPIYNNFSMSKKKIQVSVTGINSEYLLYSNYIEEIPAYSSYNLTINISSPIYFSKGKYLLKFVLVGNLGEDSSTYFREEKQVTLHMLDVSRLEANDYLNKSYFFIQEMNDSLFNIEAVSEYYSSMQNAYLDIDFGLVKDNFEKIKDLYEVSFSDYYDLVELKKQIVLAENRGISVIETKKLVSLAEVLFKRGDYLLARQNLDNAKLTYALQVKGEFSLFYSIKDNPLTYTSVSFSLALFIFGTLLFIRYRIYHTKINSYIGEEKILLDLMKVVQRKAFSENKMSMEEYQEAMRQYEAKLRKIVEERIKTETLLVNMLRIGGKRKALNDEKAKIIQLIKNTQDKYLNQGALETRIYENMLRTYSTRLGKIEEELVYLEAKEHFGSIKNLFYMRGSKK